MALNYHKEAGRVLRTNGMEAGGEMMLKAEYPHQVSSAFIEIWDRCLAPSSLTHGLKFNQCLHASCL